MPNISAYVIPTGGAIALTFTTAVSGNITLSRATSGVSGLSSFTPLYSGAPLTNSAVDQFFLDVGDQLPAPLLPNALYVYQIEDTAGTVQTAPQIPVCAITLEPDEITLVLYRLLQAGVSNIQPPQGISGIQPARITQAMPLVGLPPLPLVVVTPELLQQGDQQIGDDVPMPDKNNVWVMSEYAKRVYRVSILSMSAVERDFYVQAILAIFKTALAYAFAPIGENIRHSYECHSYQQTSEPKAMMPGFYAADILLVLEGTFNVKITTTYGLINAISTTVTSVGPDPSQPGVVDTIIVGNSSYLITDDGSFLVTDDGAYLITG